MYVPPVGGYGILKRVDLKMGLSMKKGMSFYTEKTNLRTGDGKLLSLALEKGQDLQNRALPAAPPKILHTPVG